MLSKCELRYYYRIIVSTEALSVFERNRAWHISEQLNIPAMRQACDCLVGHHDFSSFRAAGCQAKSPFKTLDELGVCEMPLGLCYPSEAMRTKCGDENRELKEERACSVEFSNSKSQLNTAGLEDALVELPKKKPQQPHCYVITARARSFLYHQVRLMVGLLKAVGTGEVQVSDVPILLEARMVTKVPPMAPACGLYLADVKYCLDS
ncbi:hypothetical protein L7F22_014716 [Adiantum nelumboides]|nr:hypothetical protein [Adiantum nelumboides]